MIGTLPDSLFKGTPSLIFTVLVATMMKWIGMSKYQIITTVIFLILLAIIICLCGVIQSKLNIRIIPLILYDVSVHYIWGLFFTSLLVGLLVFSIWFMIQLIQLIEYLF